MKKKVPTRILREVEILARMHTALAIQTLADIAMDSEEKGSARVAACNALLDRGWGRPQQTVAVENNAPEHMTDERLTDAIANRIAQIARGVGSGASGPEALGDADGGEEAEGSAVAS